MFSQANIIALTQRVSIVVFAWRKINRNFCWWNWFEYAWTTHRDPVFHPVVWSVLHDPKLKSGFCSANYGVFLEFWSNRHVTYNLRTTILKLKLSAFAMAHNSPAAVISDRKQKWEPYPMMSERIYRFSSSFQNSRWAFMTFKQHHYFVQFQSYFDDVHPHFSSFIHVHWIKMKLLTFHPKE